MDFLINFCVQRRRGRLSDYCLFARIYTSGNLVGIHGSAPWYAEYKSAALLLSYMPLLVQPEGVEPSSS